MTDPRVTATEADREAAALLYDRISNPSWNSATDAHTQAAQHMIEGKGDASPFVQAFTRHRLAHQPASADREDLSKRLLEAADQERDCASEQDFWHKELLRAAAVALASSEREAESGVATFSEGIADSNCDCLRPNTSNTIGPGKGEPVSLDSSNIPDAAIEAAFKAIAGPDVDPFDNAETWSFAETIAAAVLAANIPAPTREVSGLREADHLAGVEADYDERARILLRSEVGDGEKGVSVSWGGNPDIKAHQALAAIRAALASTGDAIGGGE